MHLRVAIVAPGAMGSAVAARLAEHGTEVITLLEGRSAATRERALAAGMRGVTEDEVAAADVILSIVPPADAVALAERLAEPMLRSHKKGIYVDCNAINVDTVKRVGEIVGGSGMDFVDGGIIGLPPKPGQKGPTVYVSGERAGALRRLEALGLAIKVMDAPIGAASALKMSYAGITKGLTALASAMILAAARAGASEALRTELLDSQPQLLQRFSRTLPDMYPKAYRWVAEMQEIAGFLSEDRGASQMLTGAAELYERLAADVAGPRREIAMIDSFLAAVT